MNEHHDATREDVVIGRIVDGEASPADWRDLDAIAERDPGVWRRLAEAQRAHARLEEAVEDAIAISELIDLPQPERGRSEVVARIGRFSGWAVAALLALALLGPWRNSFITTNSPGPATNGGAQPQQIASLLPLEQATPEQAWNRYIDAGTAQGRVVERGPDVLLRAVEAPGSDVREVYILRQVLEKVQVRDMSVIDLHQSETGAPVPVRSPVKTFGSGQPL